MLVRAGLISQLQLDSARSEAARDGGSAAEILVLNGAMDDDTLTAFYCEHLLLPRIPSEECRRFDKRVIARIPKDMALELRAIPVSVDKDGYLTVMMSDPGDSQAIDEIVFHTGAYVIRAVSTQVQIAWCLDHYYGVQTKLFTKHFSKDADVLKAPPVVEETETRTDERNAPPRVIRQSGNGSARVIYEADTPRVRPSTEEPMSRVVSGTIAGPSQTPPLKPAVLPTMVNASHSLSIPLADEATPPPPFDPMELSAELSPERQSSLDLLSTLRQIDTANERDMILNIMLNHFSTQYRRLVFFARRKETLHAWSSEINGVNNKASGTLALHLNSSFKDVVESRLPFKGSVTDAASRQLLDLSIGECPNEILLIPVTLNGRVIGVLAAADPMTPPSSEGLALVLRAVSEGLKRIVLEQKPT